MGLELLQIPLSGLLDNTRGGLFAGKFDSRISLKIPSMMLTSLMLIYSCGGIDSFYSIAALLWLPLSAQIFGTGNPTGKALLGHAIYKIDGVVNKDDWEKYQWTDNAWWTLAALGLLWSAGFIPLAFMNHSFAAVPIAYVIATPAAGWLARDWHGGEWKFIERWRGALAIYITMLLVPIINYLENTL